MQPKTKFALGGMAGLLAVLLIGGNALRSRHETEAALANLQAKRKSLETEVKRAADRLAAAEQNRAELARTLVERKMAKPSAVVTLGNKASPPESARTMTEIISNDPKAEVLMLRWQRAVVGIEYGPFFRARGISPEQIKTFEDNWVKRAESDIDLRAAGRLQGEAGRETIAALQQQAKDDYEASQIQALGPERYAQLKEYERTEVVRNVVVLGLAGAAALEGVPLTAQQGEQLWAAALDATGRDTTVEGEQLVRAIDWDALDARARQILSPEQFVLYYSGSAPSGFQSRWKYQLDVAVTRAWQADAANASAAPAK